MRAPACSTPRPAPPRARTLSRAPARARRLWSWPPREHRASSRDAAMRAPRTHFRPHLEREMPPRPHFPTGDPLEGGTGWSVRLRPLTEQSGGARQAAPTCALRQPMRAWPSDVMPLPDPGEERPRSPVRTAQTHPRGSRRFHCGGVRAGPAPWCMPPVDLPSPGPSPPLLHGGPLVPTCDLLCTCSCPPPRPRESVPCPLFSAGAPPAIPAASGPGRLMDPVPGPERSCRPPCPRVSVCECLSLRLSAAVTA